LTWVPNGQRRVGHGHGSASKGSRWRSAGVEVLAVPGDEPLLDGHRGVGAERPGQRQHGKSKHARWTAAGRAASGNPSVRVAAMPET